MRTTVVPAQVTTVEDKIVGQLGLSQMLLLTIPIFGGSAAFVILPPFFSYAIYKIVIIFCLVVISGLLAIRIKGKILLTWIIIALSYNFRPRYYVFNKNTEHLRYEKLRGKLTDEVSSAIDQTKIYDTTNTLSIPERFAAERIIEDPQANVHFKTNRKGELKVYVTEV